MKGLFYLYCVKKYILAAMVAWGCTAQAASCDLSYLPLGTATYQVSVSGQKTSFSTTSQWQGNGAQGFSSRLDIKYDWKCVGRELRSIIYNKGQIVEMTKGTFMPAAQDWKVGYKWGNEALVKVDNKILIKAVAKNHIVAQEEVKTPAGTFKTFKVEASATNDQNSLVVKQTYWYAKYYGLVKMIDHNGGPSMVLQKFSKWKR